MESKRTRYNALVSAAGIVFGMGGYIGHLYSSAIATFGMMAIFFLGFALVRFLTPKE